MEKLPPAAQVAWIAAISALIILGILTGCTRTVYVPIETVVERDAQIVERTVSQLDTVYVPLPVESRETVTRDTTSTLRTSVVESSASILADGSLLHTLRNLPQTAAGLRPSTHTTRDSVATERRRVEVPVPVPAPLTWWQQTRLRWWWLPVLTTLLLSVYTFRRPLLRILRKLIG